MKLKFVFTKEKERCLNKCIYKHFDKGVDIQGLINLILKNFFKEYIKRNSLDQAELNKKNIVRFMVPKIIEFINNFKCWDEIEIYENINFPFDYFNKKLVTSSKIF